ncbi:hypothetical protein LTR10_023231 [Elasticomyces elasticus]|uniref:Uncharacterized protein n=1 Tax=Exophiala sideris TaxID=1016849 RepID=A0ABR0JJE1_9EURO|nr:hypothetical protein LTR10_023231 [Elasticomyces elasticus]KAK5035191.1 hypothetical protein LTS07_002627 [Exophiala sideris]KAK5039457.1 hypothetical protein LTR13_003714 [Exophiala sideris]KAK5066115.1 hypothetical protein LTR69_002633 [Exophiala sideris]KAK5186792.1 hypothetical protein LTR44_000798 [Eurotiomycetes sp. CCFEE 6388]
MSAVNSPARRVLGEKDPNTLLAQIQSPKKARLDIGFASPRSLKPPHASGSPHAGQKRKIHQVEDEEAAESQNSNALQILSQRTDLLSDEEPSMHEEGFYTSMAEIKSTPNTLLTSFRASQEEHPQLEAEFVILDEPSQQTLDKMHAVSFTQTTSQLVPSLRPDLVKEPSQLSLSMSSLIDFDNNLSSQGDDMQMLEEPVQGHNSEKDTRKQMLLEVFYTTCALVPSLTSPAESRNSSDATSARLLQGGNQPDLQALRAPSGTQGEVILSGPGKVVIFLVNAETSFRTPTGEHHVSRNSGRYRTCESNDGT